MPYTKQVHERNRRREREGKGEGERGREKDSANQDFQHLMCIYNTDSDSVALGLGFCIFSKFPGEADAVKVYWFMHLTLNSKMVNVQNKKSVGPIGFTPFPPL